MLSNRRTPSPGKVVALRADDPVFWLNRGHQLLLRERPQDAGMCFDHALDAAPEDLVLLNARARTHMAMGELEPAIELLEQACELDDSVAELWNNRGVAQARAGDTQAAFDSFAQALALDPEDSSVLCNRAMVHVGAGRHELALEDLCAAIERSPCCVTSWSSKGATHLRVGQLRLARQAFLQAARLAATQRRSKRQAGALLILATSIGLAIRFRSDP